VCGDAKAGWMLPSFERMTYRLMNDSNVYRSHAGRRSAHLKKKT
jgi:hypothetical protein